MKLIKETDPVISSERKRKRGLFKCGYCGGLVDRCFYTGKLSDSCGCTQWSGSHGGTHTRLFNIRKGMIQRTTNKNNPSYHNYGGRGIDICDEWLKSFESFRDWAIENGYNDSLEIDRKDNDKGYIPENCRFVTKKANIRNSRSSKLNTRKAEIIRDLSRGRKISNRAIGRLFGVDHKTIGAIVNGKSWT